MRKGQIGRIIQVVGYSGPGTLERLGGGRCLGRKSYMVNPWKVQDGKLRARLASRGESVGWGTCGNQL